MIDATKDNYMIEAGTRLLEKAYGWIDRASFKQKALSLLILTMLIYGAGIGYVWTFTEATPASGDVVTFRSRTQTILDGGLLYQDVHTETPPLINYLMVPSQLLGGADHPGIYAAYASLFVLLLSLMMYVWFRRHDERRAYLVGLFVLICPFLFTRTIVGDDDSIVAFFFMLGAVSLLFEKPRASAAAIAVGVWVKMWAILLLPVQFLRLKTWRERIETIAIVALVSALVALPFLALCYDEFVEFLSYYFLSKSNRTWEGFSIAHFLKQGGFVIPSELILGLVMISLLAAVLYSHKKGWGAWKCATFVMIVFIAVYPKMHMGYYVMPMALLMVWAVDDWKIMVEMFAAYIPLSFASRCEPGMSDYLMTQFGNPWLPGLVLATVGTLMFLDAARRAFKRESFNEQKDGARGRGGLIIAREADQGNSSPRSSI